MFLYVWCQSVTDIFLLLYLHLYCVFSATVDALLLEPLLLHFYYSPSTITSAVVTLPFYYYIFTATTFFYFLFIQLTLVPFFFSYY